VSSRPQRARAFAPASVGNVAVGFDILGHAFAGLGDTVEVTRIEEPVVRVDTITGVVVDLPRDPERNTAARAVAAFRAAHELRHGFALSIHKGIPLGSGLGGSAASAVAALIAANVVAGRPCKREQLYPYALDGEAAASGARHGDNVGPQLLGGLVLATADRLVPIPVPPGLTCLVVHPDLVLETRRARACLHDPFPLASIVQQSAHLALFLTGCHRGEIGLLRAAMKDVLIEPRRASLIPGFAAVKAAAESHGAIGVSISGAGPSMFAWFEHEAAARAAAPHLQAGFAEDGLLADVWFSPVNAPGAKLL
jgi:homoserine kinase